MLKEDAHAAELLVLGYLVAEDGVVAHERVVVVVGGDVHDERAGRCVLHDVAYVGRFVEDGRVVVDVNEADVDDCCAVHAAFGAALVRRDHVE